MIDLHTGQDPSERLGQAAWETPEKRISMTQHALKPLRTRLSGLVLRFRDDEDPYERDDAGEIVENDGEQVLKEGWEYDDDGKPQKIDDADPDDDDPNEENATEERIKALEESLRKERQIRRKIERDAKRAARKKSSDKQEEDEAQLKQQLEASNARSQKLAEGLLRKEIDSAIMAEARRQGFIDPSDAVTDSIRAEIDADQDEEDPTDIDIDADTVRDAVKELAGRKKHLIGKPNDGTPSGGKFRQGGGKKDDKPTETALQGYYPSLRP